MHERVPHTLALGGAAHRKRGDWEAHGSPCRTISLKCNQAGKYSLCVFLVILRLWVLPSESFIYLLILPRARLSSGVGWLYLTVFRDLTVTFRFTLSLSFIRGSSVSDLRMSLQRRWALHESRWCSPSHTPTLF